MYMFPINKIPFDTTNIPARIVECFDEALICRANSCYTASGIMIRKTLEIICEELGLHGSNLAARVAGIKDKVTMPPELLAGLDDIRLLGNDAAHVESKTFSTISAEELDISIEIVKEVLKGVYQYQSLLDRIRALKKPPTP